MLAISGPSTESRREMERRFRESLRRQRKLDRGAAIDPLSQAEANARRSTLRQLPGSPYPGRPEDDFSVLEAVDGYAPLRNGLRRIAAKTEEWAGIPMPMEDANLVIEPTYPGAALLSDIGKKPDEPDGERIEPGMIRNRFWSFHRRQTVVVWNDDGKVQWGCEGWGNAVSMLMGALAVSDAWGIEQEKRAIDTLGEMLRHRQFKQYLLTGMFMEKSKRSGVHYLFRRLRPTLAISTATGTTRILAALCLHPIAYYAGSWAGAMCPTDDVLAHLALMRGDEHMFWRRANQHPAHSPLSGIGT